MSIVTENDLREVNQKIDKLIELTNSNQQIMETRFNDLEKSQIRLETKLEGVNTRLENIEAINRVAIGALFAGIGLAVLKVFFSQV